MHVKTFTTPVDKIKNMKFLLCTENFGKNERKFLGIKFAPLFIPLTRRWETFCIWVRFSFYVGIMQYTPLLIWLYGYLLFHPYLKYFTLCHICWFIYSWNATFQGRRSVRFLKRFLVEAGDYFPAKLVKTVDLPAGTNYLFGAYPHGVYGLGIMVNFLISDRFEKIFPQLECNFVVLSTIFKVPFLRELFHLQGMSPSNRENILYHLSNPNKNEVTIVLIGGTAEMMLSEPGTNKVIINNRKGFVRLALKTGSSLVPVYTFGENDVLPQYRSKLFLEFQKFLKKYTSVFPVILKGRGLFQYTFGILPHRGPLTTVVGKPISLPKIENPSEEIVDEYHQKFKIGLIELFESNKEKYDRKGKEAQLVCL